ncbi:MAG TPA: hypothetical protein PK239_14735 [Chitinophagales bacterium]|nr:hypothetical protein [Chitinophagales bacterium]
MKTLINRFFTLFYAFFALFRRGAGRDARGSTQKPDKMLHNLSSDFIPDLTYKPAQMPRKKRPFNNKKQTKGRNFYYDPKTGKKLFHTHSFAMGNL